MGTDKPSSALALQRLRSRLKIIASKAEDGEACRAAWALYLIDSADGEPDMGRLEEILCAGMAPADGAQGGRGVAVPFLCKG